MEIIGLFALVVLVYLIGYFSGRFDQRRADQKEIDSAHWMRTAAISAEQWLVSDYREAAEVATWIRRCGEGRDPYHGDFIRQRLRRGQRYE